jgi:hypothetical protein
MRSSASTQITAQFISSILAARHTPVAEVAETVAIVAQTVAQLLVAPVAPLDLPAATVTAKPPARRGRPPRSAAAAAPVAIEPPVKPARAPRRQRVAAQPLFAEIESVDETTEAPASRLLRRSAVTPAATAAVDPFERERATGRDVAVKGVVKWFDTRNSKGVLRLTGMAGDVTLDAVILAKSRVKRLYKDQEVVVIGDYLADGRFEPKSISVPGQTREMLMSNDQILHNAGRQSRPVYVEVKRLSPRMQSARAEAEHALGRIGTKSGL